MTILTKKQVQEIMQANPNATAFEVPEGITSIEELAFWGYSGLTSIEIPDSVTSIGESAFLKCSGLRSIELPEGLESIEEYAFWYCSNLESIVLPESVTSIGAGAFRLCSGLESIELPEGLESIGDSTFSGCSVLESIVIPDSVTSIGEAAFLDCSGLTSIVIPEGVKSIGKYAFWGCKSLTSIELPKGLESIEDSAFFDCMSLTSIVIPEGVKSIGAVTFGFFSDLSHIIAPEHLHEQLKKEYPDKTIMTQAQCDNAIARKIQQHTQGSSSAQDTEKITEMVKTLSPSTKASLMILNIPKDKKFSHLSNKELVQWFGDEPASLLPLLGIESKEVALGYNTEVGSVIASHLTVREKILLDATAKGEVLKQPRPDIAPEMPKEKTSKVISLGQSLEASDSLSMQSDQGSQEGTVEEKPSSSTSSPRGHK